MRRFATWTTGHRKTVIFGWIAALIVMVGLAGSVGPDYSEEFKLPTSDSTEAYELLEDNFPLAVGWHLDDRLQGRRRGRIARRSRRRWKASSRRSKKSRT